MGAIKNEPMTQQRRVSLGLIFVGLLFICVGRVAMVGPRLMTLNQPNRLTGQQGQFASMNALQLDRHSHKQAKIPWLIHQSWKSVDKIPARFKPWMRSWRELNPQWRYVFWTDADNLAIFERVYPQYLYIAKAMSKIALADMARYALLHHFGGLYADADFECVQPFGGLHEEYELFLSSEPRAHAVLLENSDSPALCNALMASVPGHMFWMRVLESIKTKFDGNPKLTDPVSLTGPRIVKSTYYSGFENDPHVAVLPPTYFYPEIAYWNRGNLLAKCKDRHDKAGKEVCAWLKQYPDGEFTEKTHATHHWQCTWCRGAGDETVTLSSIFPTSVYRPSFNESNEPKLVPLLA